ncbi:WD40 repeat domain-containing protein [Moorena producens]|uniref:WD40 repeat domain-containing protein n=1 Tax=Moorena producens TaxID=1155739 RepID=UPI003C7333CD
MSTKSKKTNQLKQLDKQQFSEYITALVWSKQGNYLAIVTAAGELALWQQGNLEILTASHDYSLDCVGFSQDGNYLGTAGQEGKVRIWQLGVNSPKFTLNTTLDQGNAWIDSLAWHPQKNLLAFAVNRQVKVWDVNQGEVMAELNFADSSVFNIAWHPQGKFLAASGHGSVKVWNIENWSEPPETLEVPGASLDCAWSSNGDYLASGNLDRTISLLHWGNPSPWLMQGFPGKVSKVVWSNTSDPVLASSCQDAVIVWQFSNEIKNWENRVLQHDQAIQAITFAPNSSLLTSASNDGGIQLWSKAKKLSKIVSGKIKFSCLAWNPTGDYLAAGGQNGEVIIWQNSISSGGFGRVR